MVSQNTSNSTIATNFTSFLDIEKSYRQNSIP